jgi:hypothetical protein
MRRTLLLTLLAILAVPVTALAGQEAPGDGTLSVRNGEGFVAFNNFRGALIGKTGAGTLLEVEVAFTADCESQNVFGEDRIVQRDKLDEFGLPSRIICSYSSRQGVLRFRFVDTLPQIVRFKKATGLAFSAVGRGIVSMKGSGGVEDGQFQLNSEPFVSLPDELTRVTLAAPSNAPG